MTFITSYLEYTKQYESPSSFWKWSAYATLAGLVRDSCYIRQKDLVIYPNIYVLEVAQSSVDRKGNPLALCEKLLRKVNNTKIISGRTSIQALVHELAMSSTNAITGEVLKGGSAIFLAPELSAGLVGDPAALGILTDIYDARGDYTTNLKGSGKHDIKNVCLTMFAASNMDMLKGEGLFDNKGVLGGLLARTFLVRPDEFRPANSLFNVDLEKIEEGIKELVKLLKDLACVHGQMILDVPAQKEWNEWYIPFRESYRGRNDKSGISGRIHTSILKLAILICINDTKDKIIRKDHVRRAIDDATELLPNYQEFIMGAGKSSMAEAGQMVLKAIYEAKDHTLSKKIILQKHWSDIDVETLDKVIATLTAADLVSQTINGSDLLYIMRPRCIEMLFQKVEKKEN